MKFIHLSDLHLGKRVNEYSMLDDQEYILKKIINVVDTEKPDGVIIAGDVYDKSVPAAEAVQLFDNFLVQLAKRKLEVFVISGNHDSPERIAFGSRIMDASGIHMSPVYNGKIVPFSMQDEYGTVDVYMLPFIKPAHVRRFCDDEITTSLSERFCSAEATIIFAIRPYSTFLQEFQCQMIALGKPVYIFEDISPYRHLIEKAGSKNNVVVVSPTGGILSALGSEIKSVPGDKTAIICENYACGETEGLLQLFDHVYRLKIQTNDIEYMELYGKYAIEFLFEMILGDTIAKLQSNRNKP